MRCFGTDGVRGAYGSEFVRGLFFKKIAHALELFGKRKLQKSVLKIVIGHDTRSSGIALKKALFDAFSDSVTVLDCGVVPTPAIAYNTLNEHADFGLSITASHNPYTDNGIKIFNSFGEKLSFSDELEFEESINMRRFLLKKKCEIVDFHDTAIKNYCKLVVSAADGLRFDGFKILLDTANGATSKTTGQILHSLGVDIVQINNKPTGKNINKNCGSEHANTLQPAKFGCDIGIAHDGDGDRVVFVDEMQRVIPGDKILAIFGKNILATSKNKVVVATLQSNFGLDSAIKKSGGRLERSDVGDREVYYKMLECDSEFGGENSGHMIFRNILSTGDGAISAINLLKILKNTGKKLSDLADEITLFPQRTFNIKVAEKVPLDKMPELVRDLENFRMTLEDSGRILVRYSGTEPKLRVLVEAKTESLVDQKADELKNIINIHFKHLLT